MTLNETLARGNINAHQHVKHHVGLLCVFYRDKFQNPAGRVHGRLPQLFGVHFSQTFVALNGEFGFPDAPTFVGGRDPDPFGHRGFTFGRLLLGNFSNFRLQRNMLAYEFHPFFVRIRIVDFLPLLNFKQGRLCDVDVSAFYQWLEVPVEESEKKGANVRAVHVGICRDNYFVIAEFFYIEYIADCSAESNDKILDLLRGKHLINARALNVEDFPAERQDSLYAPVAPHFRAIVHKYAACKSKIMSVGNFQVVHVYSFADVLYAYNLVVVMFNCLKQSLFVVVKETACYRVKTKQ